MKFSKWIIGEAKRDFLVGLTAGVMGLVSGTASAAVVVSPSSDVITIDGFTQYDGGLLSFGPLSTGPSTSVSDGVSYAGAAGPFATASGDLATGNMYVNTKSGDYFGLTTTRAALHRQLVFTNSTATSALYTLDLLIPNAFLRTVYADGSEFATYDYRISTGAMTWFQSQASLLNGVLTTSGTPLTPSTESSGAWDPDYGVYFYEFSAGPTSVIISLGLLDPGESLTLDFDLAVETSSDPSSRFCNSDSGCLAWASIADPNGFSGAPITITAVAPNGVPVPGTFFLVALGLFGIRLVARRI